MLILLVLIFEAQTEESALRVLREVALLHPCEEGGVALDEFADGLALVLAEVDHFLTRIIQHDAACKVYILAPA